MAGKGHGPMCPVVTFRQYWCELKMGNVVTGHSASSLAIVCTLKLARSQPLLETIQCESVLLGTLLLFFLRKIGYVPETP